MAWYYCTCSKKTEDEKKTKKNDLKVRQGRSPYREVNADKDGVCLNCGHYAIASHRRVDPETGSLYQQITGYKSEVNNLRKHINKRVRDNNDKKRADKNGNLDAR